jgi:transcriptional regulator with XRE-family HTH domain
MKRYERITLAEVLGTTQEEAEREMAKESLIFDVTNSIWGRLNKKNVTVSELAKRIGKTQAHVSQVLNGKRNMTLATVSDLAFALDCQFKVEIVDGRYKEFNDDVEEEVEEIFPIHNPWIANRQFEVSTPVEYENQVEAA